jgi:CO/xanthine dehydrogenase Mo-binding subunit
MRLTRRSFLELLGSSTAFAITYSCSGEGDSAVRIPLPEGDEELPNHIKHFVDYTDWLFIHNDGSVTAHTGRVDMGQGLMTVLSNILSQGLQLPPDAVELVMGDTALCPDDGPTSGSVATRIVGWGYWRACERIRDHLTVRASEILAVPADELEYRDGAVIGRTDASRRLEIGEMADGTLHLATINPREPYVSGTRYVDRRTPNVKGEAIVTGTLTYTADLFPGEVAYGSWLLAPYHSYLTRLKKADLDRARRIPGVEDAQLIWNTAMVVGSSFQAVKRGLGAVSPRWTIPKRPVELEVEREIREGASLRKVMEEQGDLENGFSQSSVQLSETYITQYATQVPIETETAIAEVDGDQATIWASVQAPFRARKRVAEHLGIPEVNVRIRSMPVGGGFGVKVGTNAPRIAAGFARAAGRRVKVVYSRAQQFVGDARFKEAVVADLRSGVAPDGTLLARTIDLYQDEGYGTEKTYAIPNVRARLFMTPMPARHGVMRGTSFVQTCFAVESHTDMVAEAVGLDPVTFRKINLATREFAPLLDACAEMIEYQERKPPENNGIGFAICHHGGRQLGAVAAEVSVDRRTGVVKVIHLVGAFDIGVIINRNTLKANTEGAMLWGLGYALFEEVQMDGHKATTRSMSDYRIPRFSDVPPIETVYFDNVTKGKMPRGCGELPVVPTIGAIANAVYNAVGLRFYTLPMTPTRVLEGLREN